MDEADRALREAEEQIEAWLCELDATWTRLLADARIEATRIVAAARDEADAILEDARARLAQAEHDSTTLLAGTARLARMQMAESEAEVVRARALAVESSATAQALALAADAAARGHVEVHDLAALGTAVERLRAELSRVVDAAFDALPAVEATAAALGLEDHDVATAPRKRRGIVRRLLRV